jgi:hypothetical protein
MTPAAYSSGLARIRSVLALNASAPDALVDSAQLEARTRETAAAALACGVSYPALCAELGRVAVEALERDRLGAIAVGRAMARWAAPAYGRTAADQ